MLDDASLSTARLAHTLEVLAGLSYRAGELEPYLTQVARGVSELLGVDWSVVTMQVDGQAYRTLASTLSLEDPEATYDMHVSVAGRVIRSGCPLVVEDIDTAQTFAPAERAAAMPKGYRSYLGVPLRLPSGESIGTVCSFHRRPRRFDAQDVRIAGLFAERAAVAIDNYRLYQRQRALSAGLEEEVARRSEELRVAQGQLVEAERLRAVGELAASIVHEVRSPLSAIGMVLQYLADVDLPEAARKRVQIAVGEAGRLQGLLGEILAYARPSQLTLSTFELAPLVRETLGSCADLEQARGRRMALDEVPAGLTVWADPDKLKQVLYNLLTNACEAVGPGDTVHTVLAPSPDGGVCIAVRNAGEPVPPALVQRLTEPFFTRKPAGTGLGLAIVQRIVDAHGGILTITSDAQHGTEVRVCLPHGPEASR